MRLFIAINFDKDTKAALKALLDELRSESERGNFSAIENLHLTLVFLGERNEKQAAAAKTVLEQIDFSSFDISVEQLGYFKRDSGGIWWASLRENKALSDLQEKLSAQLREAGFVLVDRKFSPHITLGRKVVTDCQPRILKPFGETVTSIELMKSERINGKMIYTPIAAIPSAYAVKKAD